MSIAIFSSTESNFSVMDIEIGLTAIAFAAAFAWPTFGSRSFLWIERLFGKLAHRRGLAVITVGLSVLFLRLAMLPVHPIPVPFRPDDFSNLLAADTFAHGHLTNPTPAMWVHFETIHIDHEAHLYVDVLSRAGPGSCRGQSSVRAAVVRCPHFRRSDVRRPLLDAAGLVAAFMGTAGRIPCSPASRPLQLLDQRLR